MRINLLDFLLIFLPGIRRYSLSVILILGFFTAFPQKSKSELEEEKRLNLRKIAEAEKILSETESQKKATIGQLTAINQQISAREALIKSINDEISLLNTEITDLSIVTNALRRDLKNLKEEYARMIYASYKVNHGFNVLTFLFSAETFNQFFMRLKYLEQYSEARKVQAEQIEVVTQELNEQRTKVENKKDEQQQLLIQQIKENEKLLGLKNRKSSLVADLNRKEKDLRKEMAERKAAVDRLDNLIADLIRDELEKSRTMSTATIASEEEISSMFEEKKAQLRWPVSSGFISSKFGRHPHPVLKSIIVDNTGIDIQTNKNEVVKSVFDGEVKTKAFVPGMNNVVIIKHGNYYTVYSRLKEVSVERGEKIKADQIIGKVNTNGEGVSEVHFEVWKNTEKLDPEKWLSKS